MASLLKDFGTCHPEEPQATKDLGIYSTNAEMDHVYPERNEKDPSASPQDDSQRAQHANSFFNEPSNAAALPNRSCVTIATHASVFTPVHYTECGVQGPFAEMMSCMAKSKCDDPVTAQDLEEFVRSNSDFAFEMSVLAKLRALGFDCSHSGTYRDPVTDKIRQFDIRAVAHRDNGTLALAAECKNLRPRSPLLLSAVPRTASESFHNVLQRNSPSCTLALSVRTVVGNNSVYRPGEMVGKKTRPSVSKRAKQTG